MRYRRPRSQSRLKKTTGWLLSAFLLLLYFSPQAELLRTLPDTLNVAMGQRAVIDTAFPLSVNVREGDVQAISYLD